MKNYWFFSAALLLGISMPCLADTAPLGVASAFNLVALGNGVTPGNIGDSADIEGRIAAANNITVSTSIGATLGSDPYGSLASGYAMVAGNAVTAGGYFNVGGGGNVYAPSNNSNYNWNESPQGHVVSTGPDPINFTTLAASMDSLSQQLAMLSATGVSGAPTPGGGNPSWFVLTGTSSTLNVFTITAAEFASSNNPIDINVPAGSTVIINVIGGVNGSYTLGTGIYFNGNQEGDQNNDGGMILFNFYDASSVVIDGQFDGALLAPTAVLTGGSQMGGNFIAAEVGQTGEVHYIPFDGTLPQSTPPAVTPEPGSLLLLATGLGAMALLVGRTARA